jgi:ribonuclease P protein component
VKRRHRLRNRRDFAAVRQRRLVARSGPLRCHAAENRIGVARVGFAIPGSSAGAVVRNRLRRRLRALLAVRLPALAALDVVVVTDQAAASLSAAELDAHLDHCLRTLRARLRASASRSRNSRRFGSPVSGSCWAR